MEQKKKLAEISGWYVKQKLTPEEEKKQQEEVKAWWDRRVMLHYRQLVGEVPAKMNMELGKLAYKQGKTFPELVEIILADYMRNNGYNPEKDFFTADGRSFEIGNYAGKPFEIENWMEG
jgi:hypothetical protein